MSFQNLVNLANEKADGSANSRKYLENEGEQRSSLPDIPLTNREKAELENSMLMQGSQSSESILQIVPPPKPSKDRKPSAPPLPPKKKTFSIDEIDDVDNIRQHSTPSDVLFGRSIDFENDGFERIDAGRSRSATEKSFAASKFVNETGSSKTMISTQQKQFNELNFSSIDMKECKIHISQEMNSRAFSAMSSNVQELDNSFGFMSLNQSDLMTEQALSNDSFCLSDEHPPPLPIKTRSRSLRLEHHKSVYDNVEDMNRNSLDTNKASTTSSNSSLTSSLSARTENTTDHNYLQAIVKNKYKSCIESSSGFNIDRINDNSENPPPLPLKKKHSKFLCRYQA